MTKKWLDVSPKDWFYRSVLEADKIFIDSKREETLFTPKRYNKFVTGKSRKVYNFTTTGGQTKFHIKGYKPDSRETVVVYVDGVPYNPTKLEKDYVHVGFPMAGNKQVSICLSGVVQMHQGDHTPKNCQTYPLTSTCSLAYPSKKLEMSKKYVFDLRYSLNEVAVCMSKKLTRVNVDKAEGESIQAALTRSIGDKDDCFTIIDGVLYVSYNLNQFPIYVNYNYKSGAVVKNRQKEKVVPSSKCVMNNDRFFPNITVSRAEFFVILQRMRNSLYGKYTDRGYHPNSVDKTERHISDRKKIVGKWYSEDVLNILDEKFNDGCYVFPLYEDNSFQPEVCVTKAEAVVYLHRFSEWALERFR
ncbi:hypothetical protein P8860_10805 [Bacillus spizizenii]|nr:hypothetical protein [Bacillus spizizenii]